MLNLMGNTLNLKHLKRTFLSFGFLLTLTLALQGQKLTKLKSFELPYTPESVSIDRQGHFYIAFKNGSIDKYDTQGNNLYHFSPIKNGYPTLIEAWQGLRVFNYYPDFQEYLFLDRFLNNSERFRLPSDINTFNSLATISGEDDLWVINAQELSLKKIDLPTNQVVIDNPFNLNIESADFNFSHIREYQNQLFISDAASGLLIFDRFGNFISQESLQGISYFSFYRNELLYLDKNYLKLFDIYTKKKREIELPDPSFKFVLMENNFLICIADSRVDIFRIT